MLNIIRMIRKYIYKDEGVTMPIESPDEKPADWKRDTTMNHDKLIDEHLRQKAYLIAEKDGFRKNPEEYWQEAHHV